MADAPMTATPRLPVAHAADRLGPAILSGEGRLGNLATGRVVLAEVP